MSSSLKWLHLPIGTKDHNRIIPAGRLLSSLQSYLLVSAGPALRSVLVAQGFYLDGSWNFHRWRMHHLSGQSVPLCTVLRGKNIFSLHPVTTVLVPVISCPLMVHQHQEPIAVSSTASSELLRGCCKVPLKISLLQAEQFLALHPHPTVQALQLPSPQFPHPFNVSVSLSWTYSC